jgi:hypothetical protein
MRELNVNEIEQVNGGGVAKTVSKVAKTVARLAPHPVVKVAALLIAAGAAAVAGYENNRV